MSTEKRANRAARRGAASAIIAAVAMPAFALAAPADATAQPTANQTAPRTAVVQTTGHQTTGLQTNTAQPGTLQPVTNQAGTNQAGLNQASPNQVSLNQAGLNQAGLNQAGLNQAGLNQIGSVQQPAKAGALSGGSAAVAADTVGQIANGLINSRLYVTSEAGDVLSAAQRNQIEQSLAANGDADIRAMVISNNATGSQVRQLLPAVAERVDKGQTFVAVTADGSRMAAISKALDRGEINQIVTRTNGQPLEQRLIDFGNRTEKQVDENTASSAIVGYVVLAVFVVLGALVLAAFVTARKRRQVREAKEMDDLKVGVEEDVTRLGEDIARLDLDVMDKGLDPATRADYEHALDSYDRAKQATGRAARPQDMQAVTTALEDGRYYMTATRARLTGEPVPEKRPPCFFNPQHGPSAQDVMWAPPGGSTRFVPACAADAEAVTHGADPDIRMVPYRGARRPYWNAGPAYAPYAGGYYYGYGGFDLLGGLLIGTTLGSLMSGGLGWGGAGYGGMEGGGDMGGGWDFGGGDWGGGGDFGGF